MARKNQNTDDYIASRSAEVAPLMKTLRAFVHDTLPGATEDMQYGVPTIINAHGVPVIYLYGGKNHVNFGFLRSADLVDPEGVLRGSGTPSKHIKIKADQRIDKTLLEGFVMQCRDLRT